MKGRMQGNNNDRFWRFLRLLVPVILVFVGAVYAYGRLSARVDAIEDKASRIQANKVAIVQIQTKLDYIVLRVDEIKNELKNTDQK